MNAYIKSEKAEELSDNDIRRITNLSSLKVVPYHNLAKVKDIFELFNDCNCFVLLYEFNEINNGHFVACLYNEERNEIEHFDSLGFEIDYEMKYNRMNSTKYYSNLILHAIQKYKCRVIQNTTKLQKDADDINTCGKFVSVRICYKHLKLYEFLKLMKYKNLTPDEIVCLLTCLQV
jgi:hypothetical protein